MFKGLVARSLIRTVTHNKYLNATLLNLSEIGVNRKQSKELKASRKIAQKKLTEILDIKEIKALEIVTTNDTFATAPSSLISSNYELCVSNKLDKDVVLRYPYILIEKDLLKKIELLNRLSVKLSNSIALVKLSLKRIKLICSRNTETTTRINDLCRIFNITPSQSCEILAKKPFLLSVQVNHLDGNLKLLLENGISKDDVFKDMWIFKYSESFISNRLRSIKEHKVNNIKPWMIRCPEETLYRHIKRESDNRDILGENSVAEYLSERLKCSDNISKFLIRKQPALQTKSLLKMNEMIDFLYKQSFTPSQICRFPKVLLHSTKTVKNRIKELDALGHKPDSLYVLTKSQKQYVQHIEALIKTNGKVKIELFSKE